MMSPDHRHTRTDAAEGLRARPFYLRRVSPRVYSLVAEAVQEGGSDLATIARMIEQDPRLVALVLDFTNSATHALTQEVLSLRQAVALLGAERLRDFLGARSVADVTRAGKPDRL